MTPDSRYVVSASDDRSIKIFDLGEKKEVHNFENAHQGDIFNAINIDLGLEDIMTVAMTPDGKYIVSGSLDNTIKIFDFETKQEVHHFKEAHEGNYLS